MYAVPDPRVGDQVMAAVVLKDDADLTPTELESFLVRAAGPVAEGLAAVRTHQRRPAADGHQQDPQARAHQGRRDRRRGSVWERPGRERSYAIVELGSTTTTGVVDLPVFDAVDHA